MKMKRVNICIEIQSQAEGFDSALRKAPEKVGRKVDLPGTAILMPVQGDKGIRGRYIFMLNFAINLSPGLLADWLCEKINSQATRLLMDRIEVPIDKGEIERVIAEKIGRESKLQLA